MLASKTRAIAGRRPERRAWGLDFGYGGGIAMMRIALFLLVGLFLLPVLTTPAVAAEVGISSDVEQPRTVRHNHRRAERRPYFACPAGYSFYPLSTTSAPARAPPYRLPYTS